MWCFAYNGTLGHIAILEVYAKHGSRRLLTTVLNLLITIIKWHDILLSVSSLRSLVGVALLAGENVHNSLGHTLHAALSTTSDAESAALAGVVSCLIFFGG